MPCLDNPKHEAFAGHLARGLSQSKAYTQAGYNPNPAGSSRLANSPAVIARVEELKDEIASKINQAMQVTDEETFGALADLGITMEYIARRYKELSIAAEAAGQFAPAINAVDKLEKLLDISGRAGSDDENSLNAPKIAISQVNEMLGNVTEMLKAAKDSPELLDITPVEETPKKLTDDHTP